MESLKNHWQVLAEKMKQEKRSLGGGRKWRSNFNRLNTQLMELEDDHTALELVFPQVPPSPPPTPISDPGGKKRDFSPLLAQY